MPAWISVVVFALAVARVTRLITADKLTEPVRDRLAVWLWARSIPDEVAVLRFPAMSIKHSPRVAAKEVAIERYGRGAEPTPKLVYLLTCPWCASIYVAAVAAPVCWVWGDTPYAFIPALGLAFSQVTGLAAEIGD